MKFFISLLVIDVVLFVLSMRSSGWDGGDPR